MNVEEWKQAAISWFKSGNATDEHWETMASELLSTSGFRGLYGDLDEVIEANAKDTNDE